MTSSTTKFLFAVLFQVVIILGIVIFKLSILVGGTDVVLRIAPVDPRDLLRGDYVTFQYDISTIDSYYARSKSIRNGDTVYVVLQQSGQYWHVRSVEKNKPRDERIFLKGVVASGGIVEENDLETSFRFNGGNMRIVYGIEEYFIPEGRGQGVSFQNKEAAARVAVDTDGNAVLEQIYVNQVPWP